MRRSLYSLVLLLSAIGVAKAAFTEDWPWDHEFFLQAENLKEEIASVQNTDAPDNSCERFYSQIYQRPVIDVTIAFGYADPAVLPSKIGPMDHYYELALGEHLKEPCPKSDEKSRYLACGFTQVTDSPVTYAKQFQISSGETKEVRIRLASGSKDRAAAEELFLDGVSKSDIVFYLGHARDGGGPDFTPAKRLRNAHINYAWYRANRPGFKKLLAALDSAATSSRRPAPQLLGLFACTSERKFLKDLKIHAPETGFILSNDVSSFDDDFNALIGSLDAILGEKCRSAFSKSINPKLNSSGSRFLLENFLNNSG
jgi:hypothetical protein